MATPKIIADFETSLATSISVGSTSFTLASATDDDGVALPTGKYYLTVDNASNQKEYFVGTLTGTSVASVSSVSRQGAETSGAVRAHRVGASVIMTDFMTYKNYIDETTLVSAPDASTTTKGVVEAATLAEVRARTGTSSTGAVLVLTPDVMDDLPTEAEMEFISATTGMISMYASATPPTGFLLCNGQAVSRSTYASLFAVTSTTYGIGDGSTTFNVPDLAARFPLGYAATAPTKVLTFASRSSNLITITGADNHANNEIQTGQAIVYTTTGSVITGLTSGVTYYLIRNAYNQFSLATSVALANAGTAIALSSDGSGTQLFTATYTARPMAQKGGEQTHALTDAELASHSHSTYIDPTDNNDVAGGSGGGTLGSFQTGVTGGDTPHNIMPLFTVVNYIIKT